ncbi:WXG100 family type VII secretion target [Cellulomonas sp. Marseille-Q8402]
MTTLIATAEGGPALSECYQSLKIIGPASHAFAPEADGGWAVAEGLSGGVGAVADIAEFVVDPIASMAASVAGFLLDYMPPLPDMLDSIAGDPAAVAAKAETWGNISTRVTDSADDLEAQVRTALSGWSGPAAEAYGVFGDVLGDSLRALSTMCASVGGAMQGASAVVGFVRAIVRDVIADLVGKLISWASQVAATVGVGATWVVPQAVTAIAIRVERVRDWLTRLTRAIRSLATATERANEALTRGVPALRRAATALESMPVVPGPGAPALDAVLKTATSVSGTLDKTFNAAVQATGGQS